MTHGEGGFVMLVLLGIVGAGAMAVVLAVGAFVPPLADRTARTEANVAAAAAAARDAFRAVGAFPGSVDTLPAPAGTDAAGRWRYDPFAPDRTLDYAIVAAGLRLRARGADRTLGTADDVATIVAAETAERARHRGRLRLLRAVFAASEFRRAATMSALEVEAVVAAMRDYAAAKRAWLQADAAGRAALQTRLDAATATVDAATTAHGCPPLPPATTGPGGLMERLALPDALAVDGAGRTLQLDAVVGFTAIGHDATGGTDDDM